ncbi:MAG: hypothetical protein ACRCTA_00635 [Bacilli bacterium]
MPSNYKFKPRGIIKWHAFAAVISSDEQFERVVEDEDLSFSLLEDHQDYLDFILQEALNNQKKVLINYLKANELHQVKGLITLDHNSVHSLYCNQILIPLSSIKDIQIIE